MEITRVNAKKKKMQKVTKFERRKKILTLHAWSHFFAITENGSIEANKFEFVMSEKKRLNASQSCVKLTPQKTFR